MALARVDVTLQQYDPTVILPKPFLSFNEPKLPSIPFTLPILRQHEPTFILPEPKVRVCFVCRRACVG